MAEVTKILSPHSKLSTVLRILARVIKSQEIKRDSILEDSRAHNLEKVRFLVELASIPSTQIAVQSLELVGLAPYSEQERWVTQRRLSKGLFKVHGIKRLVIF